MVNATSNDWMNEPAPEELLAGNPYVVGTMYHLQWLLGTTTRWRLQKRHSTLFKSGEELGSAPNADAYAAKPGEK